MKPTMCNADEHTDVKLHDIGNGFFVLCEYGEDQECRTKSRPMYCLDELLFVHGIPTALVLQHEAYGKMKIVSNDVHLTDEERQKLSDLLEDSNYTTKRSSDIFRLYCST